SRMHSATAQGTPGYRSLVRDIVEQITVAADRIEIRLSQAKIAAVLESGGRSERPDLDPIVLLIEAPLRRAGKGKRLAIENGADAEVSPSLVAMVTEAFALRNHLLSGSDASIEAMSGRLGMNHAFRIDASGCATRSRPPSARTSGSEDPCHSAIAASARSSKSCPRRRRWCAPSSAGIGAWLHGGFARGSRSAGYQDQGQRPSRWLQ